ncbi:unnamed protein product, partial [Schistocephalus solidus]|uniref:Transposase n=1 Tax=Schistocephalus solidus TaxID=70667 RepID=A0A183TSS7_SCHSO
HSRKQGVQALVEFFIHRIRARHWGRVSADDADKLFSPKRQAEAHQAIIDTLWQTGQTSRDVVSDGKGNASVVSLCLWLAAPEGEDGTLLLQLTLLRELGLADSRYVHLVTRQLPSDKRRPPFRPVVPRIA